MEDYKELLDTLCLAKETKARLEHFLVNGNLDIKDKIEMLEIMQVANLQDQL